MSIDTRTTSILSSEHYEILIVEDHEIVRNGMNGLLQQALGEAKVSIIEADTLLKAQEIISRHSGNIDLVILDVNLPDAGGNDELDCIEHEWNDIPIVVISANEDWTLAIKFMKAGVLGFIPKSSNATIMLNALKLILAGGRYYPDEIFSSLTSELDRDSPSLSNPGRPTTTNGISDLSPRQKEVLSLILQGYSNKEIARELDVSLGTIKNYVAIILRAFNTNSRSKAMIAAMKSGMLPSKQPTPSQ